MNGYYRIDKKKCQQRLACWLEYVIREQRWVLYDDLHVDEVSKTFQARGRWYYSSLFLFDCLWKIMDKPFYDSILVMPLLETGKTTSLDCLNIDYFKKKLHDITPPSLHVFPKDSCDYCQWVQEITFLEQLSSRLKWNVYFSERYEYGTFTRSVIFRHKLKE